MKVALIINNPKFLISHRLELCLSLKDKYGDVTVITSDGDGINDLKKYGFKVEKLNFLRKKTNVFYEMYLLFRMVIILGKIKPDLVHCVTMKPIIYGGIAARFLGIKAVLFSIAGLGIIFSSARLKYKAVRLVIEPLLKFVFSHGNVAVIFQNKSDSKLLIERNVLKKHFCFWIDGSGIDTRTVDYVDEPVGTPVVTFASRLLKDKGILDFIEAIKILIENNVIAEFWIIGDEDPYNPNSISVRSLKRIFSNERVAFLGFRKDVIKLFQHSNIVVFPSYYGEGLPKVLIEAAAVGRAVVTTDHPGCRDAVIEGETALLVPVKQPAHLANAIKCLIDDNELRKNFGANARDMALRRFDVKLVVEQHIKIYEELLLHGDNTVIR